jgi:hypothetical protein
MSPLVALMPIECDTPGDIAVEQGIDDPRLDTVTHVSPYQTYVWAASVLEEQLRRYQEDHAKNAEWFADESREPGRFLHCCTVLGLEPAAVRSRLERQGHATD